MGTRSSKVIVLGVVYLILGLIALSFASAMTMGAMAVLSVVLLCSAIAQLVYAFQGRHIGLLWPHVSLGALTLVAAGMIAMIPAEGAIAFRSVIGFLLLAGGLAKVLGALTERSTGWGWYTANGVVSIILGAFAISAFPRSTFWTIGAFVGVDLIVAGLTMVGLGVAVRRERGEAIGAVQSLFPEKHPEEFRRRESRRDKDRPTPPLH